jgi:hypothetical protein
MLATGGDCSLKLTPEGGYCIVPEGSLTPLLQEIVTSGGSVTFALQSIYTVMAAQIYYAMLPQFNATTSVFRVDFKVVNAPLHWWRFIVVPAVMLGHLLIFASSPRL